jgi:hypothetical protein
MMTWKKNKLGKLLLLKTPHISLGRHNGCLPVLSAGLTSLSVASLTWATSKNSNKKSCAGIF